MNQSVCNTEEPLALEASLLRSSVCARRAVRPAPVSAHSAARSAPLSARSALRGALRLRARFCCDQSFTSTSASTEAEAVEALPLPSSTATFSAVFLRASAEPLPCPPRATLEISALVSPPCRLPLFFLFFAAAALAAARFAFGITDGRRTRKLRQASKNVAHDTSASQDHGTEA